MARGVENRRLLAAHKACIYCAGKSPANTVDHLPHRGMFIGRDRPRGHIFPSCVKCNQASRRIEDVEAFLKAVEIVESGEEYLEFFDKKLRAILNNYPRVWEELQPGAVTRSRVRGILDRHGELVGALDVSGPRVGKAMILYGAKVAMALHWLETGEIVSSDMEIAVLWYTNASAIEGEVPQHLFEMLPEGRRLQQGKKTTGDQFVYASKKTVDGPSSAHWATFGTAFMFILFVGRDIPAFKQLSPDHVVRPGCLRDTAFLTV